MQPWLIAGLRAVAGGAALAGATVLTWRRRRLRNPGTGKPDTGEPATGEPDTGKSGTGKSGTG